MSLLNCLLSLATSSGGPVSARASRAYGTDGSASSCNVRDVSVRYHRVYGVRDKKSKRSDKI